MIEKKIRKRNLRKFIEISIASSLISLSPSVLAILSGAAVGTSGVISGSLISLGTGFFTPLSFLLINEEMKESRLVRSMNILIRVIFEIALLIFVTLAIFSLLSLIVTQDLESILNSFFTALFLAVSISTIFVTASTLQAFLGRNFLRHLVKGAYNKVRREERIVVFLDLRNSTAWGEQLATDEFFSLLNDFLRLVEQCCYYYDGEIYKYMGDGIIATWKSSEEAYQQAWNMINEFCNELSRRQGYFRERYGDVIGFSVGVHCGVVVTGGIGNEKRELGYWGDVLNTTQRIESACKEQNTKVLFSEDFINTLAVTCPKEDIYSELMKIEGVQLRGKIQEMNLYGLRKECLENA
ncbi:MAG: adenylate/guanylate cyclase domain-containing protein [Spirochaetia bacterium]